MINTKNRKKFSFLPLATNFASIEHLILFGQLWCQSLPKVYLVRNLTGVILARSNTVGRHASQGSLNKVEVHLYICGRHITSLDTDYHGVLNKSQPSQP